MFAMPLFASAAVPDEYRTEVRDVLLAGKIAPDITVDQFESFVNVLSAKAYKANVTGTDLTQARVDALLGAAASAVIPPATQNTARVPNVSVLWGTVAALLLIILVMRYWRRMHNGGALGAA